MEAIDIIRVSGIAGLIGGILFVLGDLLYQHIPGSTDSLPKRMSQLSQRRLGWAGTLGMIGCWFYAAGAVHIYFALGPAGLPYAALTFGSFEAVAIAYGITHVSFFSIASGAHAAAQSGADIDSAGRFGESFYQRLVLITYVPVALVSILLVYAVASGQSLYPRWMLVFLPITLYLLRSPVLGLLRGRLHEIVRDGYDNWIFVVFYLISSLTLWNPA